MSSASSSDAPKLLISLVYLDRKPYHFRLTPSMTMAEVKTCFAQRIGCDPSTIHLEFNGQVVAEADTAESLGLYEGAVIQVI